MHSKWGARIVHPNGTIDNLIADGGLHYLPASTDDLRDEIDVSCDESMVQQGPVGPSQISSYSSTVNKNSHTHKPRLGPCDMEGFSKVIRGSKPQHLGAHRGYVRSTLSIHPPPGRP